MKLLSLCFSSSAAFFLLSFSARADVSLASLFTDHAVLQQGLPAPVWGTAGPGEKISVSYQGRTETTSADDGGRWKITLPPLAAGLSGSLVVTGSNTVTLNDVVTGEVWLCSGQSNMSFLVGAANNAAAEIAAATYPQIREFSVRPKILDKPTDTVIGQWRVCSPSTVGTFSAVGYFFARDLSQSLKVPVGVITSAHGGTIVETWTSTDALRGNPQLSIVLDRWAKELEHYPERKIAYDAAMVIWKKKVSDGGTANPPDRRGKPVLPPGPGHKDTPGGHFNGMIYPLIPYAIRGAVWYQGESSAPRASEYRGLCGAMITDWRKRWGEGPFPFLIIQLPRHVRPPVDSWAFLREAQTQLLSLDKTGLVITLDLGDTKNLHPPNKQDVGYRTALLARGLVYNQNIAFSGPLFREAKFKDATATISFKYTDKGLGARGGVPLAGFQIGGADKVFYPAVARIEGDSVLVSSPQVAAPVAVRYAWSNDPITANLVNGEGLPASPFRTDNWEK